MTTRNQIFYALGLAATTLGAGFAAPLSAQAAPGQNWVHVGTQRADFEQDRDVFQLDKIGGRLGRFRLDVRGRPVSIYSLKLVYEDGDSKSFRLRRRFYSEGERAGHFRNPDPHRKVAYIEIGHKTQHRRFGRRQATVMLYAKQRHAVTPLPRPPYEDHNSHVLGSLEAGRFWRNDTVQVGFENGRFRALKLRALHRSIKIDTVEVTFGNGRTQHIPASQVIMRGGMTAELDLNGRRRFIDQVVVRYRRLRGQRFWRTNFRKGHRRSARLQIIGIK